jgi:hypothetical protein
MSAFEAVLRQQVADSALALQQAERAGDEAAGSMYRARLWDLMDRAAANDIEAGSWIAGEISPAGSRP